MDNYYLSFKLETDATFGRGDGIAGMLNQEVQHDEYGCPYISGKTLKGLLVSSCADIMSSLKIMEKVDYWEPTSSRLFGKSGGTVEGGSILHIGDAKLPEDLRQILIYESETVGRISPEKILNIMTAIRYQTAIDDVTQVAQANMLRTERVVLKGMYFEAFLAFFEKPSDKDLQLLSACIKAFYRAGSGTSRGRGKLQADLLDNSKTSILDEHFTKFKEVVMA